MTVEEIRKSFLKPEYDFLRDNPRLGKHIAMLCLGGSISYGTNLPGKGDVDLRGVYFDSPSEIIGLNPNSSQVVEQNTDTTIYGFNKFVQLVISNNPNSIELLGCKPEHYFYLTGPIKVMLDNSKMFLSKNCIRAFAGFANQQLNRLENAIARDRLTDDKREEHILRSMENAMESFSERYTDFESGSIKLYIDESKKENKDTEIFMDIDLRHYPVRDFNSIINEITNVTRCYSKINHRNHKKDEEHLDKHAMHLLRLYLMAFDLMERQEIVTYREKDRDFLLDVRMGKFRNPDGTYNDAFFDLREEYNKRFAYDMEHTELPDKPDMSKITEFVMDVNAQIVRGEL